MSYNKRTWANGNVVGAVDLNRIEQGIEDSRGLLVVNSVYNENDDSYTLDKAWQEIYDAFPFVIEYHNENGAEGKVCVSLVYSDDNGYYVEGADRCRAYSPSDYPSLTLNE